MKTKIKKLDIYSNCGKGKGCYTEYELPYFEESWPIEANCNGGGGCSVSKKVILPYGVSVKKFK